MFETFMLKRKKQILDSVLSLIKTVLKDSLIEIIYS